MGILGRFRINVLFVVLVTVILLLGLSVPVQAEQFGDFTYTTSYGEKGIEAAITGYTGAGGDVAIPDKIGEFPVASIYEQAFYNKDEVTSINIPESVKDIGRFAFGDCSNLTSINIPESVENIGDYGFSGCRNLKSISIPQGLTRIGNGVYQGLGITKINIPEGVTSIGEGAFNACIYLSDVNLPEGLINIENGAFNQCKSLMNVVLPESVTNIEEFAFAASGLTTINIPVGVVSIESRAFASCDSLIRINVDVDNSKYTSIDGGLFNKDGTSFLAFPGGHTTFDIPQGTTSIGEGAFYYCKKLTNITIPSGVTSIGEGSFFCCINLAVVNIQGNTSIGDAAFKDCKKLSSINMSEDITNVGDYVFWGCTSLTHIELPKNLKNIGIRAFYECNRLISIRVNSATTKIFDSAETIPTNASIICYEPSPSQEYAKKFGRLFQSLGCYSPETNISQSTKTVIVKAHDKTGGLVAVPDATVYVYEKDNIPMCIGKESANNKILMTGKTDADGNCTLTPPAGGWPAGANVVACKNEVFTNDGRQQARAPYDNVVFTLQTHTLIDTPKGEWFGQLVSDIDASKELIMESPRYLCNLSLTYYYDDSSGDYYDDVERMVNELSKQLSEATDGYFAIDNIAIYGTKDLLAFRNKENRASESDIQINGLKITWSNTNNIKGFFDDNKIKYYRLLRLKNADGSDYSHTIAPPNSFSNSRVEMSKENIWDYDISDSYNYSKEALHELGHYILGCYDEYLDGDGNDWKKWYDDPLHSYHPNNWANFGLMETEYEGIELSNDSKYAYLNTENKEDKSKITLQYSENKGSCWYTLQKDFSNMSFTAVDPPDPISNSTLLNSYNFYISAPTNTKGERLFSNYDTNETILDERDLNTADYLKTSQLSTELLANVKVIADSGGDEVIIYPTKGIPVSLTQMFYDNTAPADIPLTADGTTFTGTIPVQKDNYYLRLTSTLENNETCYSDFVVESTKNTLQSTFISDDESVCISVDSATADSYNFVSQDSSISRDGYVPLTKAVFITSKDKATVNDSLLVSDVTSSALVDTATIAWYKYENNEWTSLETQKQVGDYNSITAYCDISGDGYYQLMAQPAKTANTFQPVQGLMITPNNQYDGSVNIAFTDVNNKDDIRYYKFYYSDQPFSNTNLDSVSVQMFNTYDSGYGYTFEDNTKTYYCAIQIVGKDGSVSDLSEVKSFTTGIRDTDNDGIPEAWVEQYSLRTLENQDMAISGLDNDADGLTNQQEYQHNTNPMKKDTDDDGVSDSDELAKGLNPLNAMTDGATPDYLATYGSNDFTVETAQLNAENGTNTLSISMKNLKNTIAKDVNVKLLFDDNIEWFWQSDFEANKTTDLFYVFDGDMPKTIQVSIDSDQIRYDSNYLNNIYQLSTNLQSIAITTPAVKLNYQVGESLDLTGLVVTGTYSDGTTKVETVTADNVSGFDSSNAAKDQVLTITVNGKIATYTVQIIEGTILGDVDGNGNVQAFDALMSLQIATGKKTGTPVELKAADVDKSGNVQAFDALRILQHATGKITSF